MEEENQNDQKNSRRDFLKAVILVAGTVPLAVLLKTATSSGTADNLPAAREAEFYRRIN